jgi:hypothetical protein
VSCEVSWQEADVNEDEGEREKRELPVLLLQRKDLIYK